jgi:hypothetical protein
MMATGFVCLKIKTVWPVKCGNFLANLATISSVNALFHAVIYS